jgi:hypothetical protein
MPLDAIIVEVVQNGQAGFIITLQNVIYWNEKFLVVLDNPSSCV